MATGQKLVTLEAMKMETTVYAERPGRVAEVHVQPGVQVEAGDLYEAFVKVADVLALLHLKAKKSLEK